MIYPPNGMARKYIPTKLYADEIICSQNDIPPKWWAHKIICTQNYMSTQLYANKIYDFTVLKCMESTNSLSGCQSN